MKILNWVKLLFKISPESQDPKKMQDILEYQLRIKILALERIRKLNIFWSDPATSEKDLGEYMRSI